MQSKFYDQLTSSQQEAVYHFDGPLLVIAGPGSGKTRVITYRIYALIEAGVKPYNICAITFTNKAANEMRERALSLGASWNVHISTFHSLCVRILRRYARYAGISSNFSVYDSSDQSRCMKHAVKEANLETSNFSPARMLGAVSTLKNKLIDPKTFSEEVDDFFQKSLANIYTSYQRILADRNALDFDDLLMKAAILLQSHKTVREKISNRFHYLQVDEYQDTNHAQYQIAKHIASGHNNICVTGDPDQSIYRWRGADIRNILAFEQDWPNAKVVKLEENFRSTPNILNLADKLIAYNTHRKQKTLIPTKKPGSDVIFRNVNDEIGEADFVAERVRNLLDNKVSAQQIAVFYRVNSMSRPLEEAFIKQRIPYQILRGVEFYGRKEIRDMLAYLKVIVNPDDQVALLRIINTPSRGIGKTTIERVRNYSIEKNISLYEGLAKAGEIKTLGNGPKSKIAVFVEMIEKFKDRVNDPDIEQTVELIFTESGLERSLADAGVEGKDAIDNVSELINSAAQYQKNTPEPSLLDYLKMLSLFSDTDTYDEKIEKVPLMTLHAAKGLEFDNVFIIGVEDGLLPHQRSAEDAEETEEERRLLFVGITRAKANLCITYAKYRTIRGMVNRVVPSQFLYELDAIPQSSDGNSKLLQELTYEPVYDDVLNVHDSQPPFKNHDMVRHKKFGIGRVQNFVNVGENSTITIKFNSGQTKTLLLKYAKLVKL